MVPFPASRWICIHTFEYEILLLCRLADEYRFLMHAAIVFGWSGLNLACGFHITYERGFCRGTARRPNAIEKLGGHFCRTFFWGGVRTPLTPSSCTYALCPSLDRPPNPTVCWRNGYFSSDRVPSVTRHVANGSVRVRYEWLNSTRAATSSVRERGQEVTDGSSDNQTWQRARMAKATAAAAARRSAESDRPWSAVYRMGQKTGPQTHGHNTVNP